jgi:hypothetical protein
MCVLIFLQILPETLLILRTQRDIINVRRSSRKVSIILVIIKLHLRYLDIFYKNPEIPNCLKIRLVGAKWFHMERQKWWSFAFRNFANAPKKVDSKHACLCHAFSYIRVPDMLFHAAKHTQCPIKNLKFHIVVMCVTVYSQIFYLWYIAMFIFSVCLYLSLSLSIIMLFCWLQ